MQIHKNWIHNEKDIQLSCKHCSRSFDSLDLFKIHLSVHKTPNITENIQLQKLVRLESTEIVNDRAKMLNIPEYFQMKQEHKFTTYCISPEKEVKLEKVKTEPMEVRRLLCPVGFCTFSFNANDELKQRNHIEYYHKHSDFYSLK